MNHSPITKWYQPLLKLLSRTFLIQKHNWPATSRKKKSFETSQLLPENGTIYLRDCDLSPASQGVPVTARADPRSRRRLVLRACILAYGQLVHVPLFTSKLDRGYMRMK